MLVQDAFVAGRDSGAKRQLERPLEDGGASLACPLVGRWLLLLTNNRDVCNRLPLDDSCDNVHDTHAQWIQFVGCGRITYPYQNANKRDVA